MSETGRPIKVWLKWQFFGKVHIEDEFSWLQSEIFCKKVSILPGMFKIKVHKKNIPILIAIFKTTMIQYKRVQSIKINKQNSLSQANTISDLGI